MNVHEDRLVSTQELFAGYKMPVPNAGDPQFEYEHYIKLAAKMTGSKYFVMHSRISKAFEGRSADDILDFMRRWCHEAEKSDNPGWTFNTRFKKYRNANAK